MRRTLKEYRLAFAGGMLLILVNLVAFLVPEDQVQRARVMVRETFRSGYASGFQVKVFADENGEHRYAIFVPFEATNRPFPAIVFLNGFGENGDDGVAPLLNGLAQRIRQTGGQFPFVAVFPQCHWHENNWEPGGAAQQRVPALLDRLQTDGLIDRDRIYLTGLSSGANAIFHAEQIHRYSAVMPVSGSASAIDVSSSADLPPIAALFNRFDVDGLLERHEAAHQKALSAGRESWLVDVAATDLPHTDHNAWDYTFQTGAFYSWLQQHDAQRDHVRQPLLVAGDFKHRPQAVLKVPGETFTVTFEARSTGTSPLRVAGRPVGSKGGSGWNLQFLRPEDGASGVSSNDTAWESGRLVACLSLRRKAWNTIRIQQSGREFRVYVNGWLFADAVVDSVQRVFIESTSFEIRNLRGAGVVIDPDSGIGVADFQKIPANACEFSRETICDAWERWQDQLSGHRVLQWTMSRTGDDRWSPFHAAAYRPEPAQFFYRFKDGMTDFFRPWDDAADHYTLDGFGKGLTRVDHERWMHSLRLQGTASVSQPRNSWLTLSSGRREETLADAHDGDNCRRCISAGCRTVLQEQHPAEMFDRMAQLIYQPFDAHGFGIVKEQLSVLSATELIDGHQCCVLSRHDADTGIQERYYLAPELNFAVMKYVRTGPEHRIDVATIHYQDSGQGRIQPAAWTVASTRRQDPLSETRYPGASSVIHFGTAKDVQIVDQENFPPLPRGITVVKDEVAGEWYSLDSDTQQSRLSADEVRSLADFSSWDASAAASGALVQQSSIIAAVVLLFLVGALLRWRRIRQERSISG